MADHLPDHLWHLILINLPVKSLLKCTSVSKSWHSLITSPYFISDHLTRTINPEDNLCLLTYYSNTNFKRQCNILFDKENFHIHAEFECPFTSLRKSFWLIGSVNGLICLYDHWTYTETVIYNLSIQKYIKLPSSQVTYAKVCPYIPVLGFGYDSKTNDHKVVKVSYLHGDRQWHNVLPIIVEVYALKEKTWRSVNASTVDFPQMRALSSQCFINGAIHWTAFQNDTLVEIQNCILLFDLGNEVFKKMKLPQELVGSHQWTLSASIFGGMLSVFHFDWRRNNSRCNIWVKNDYGAESWSIIWGIDIAGGLEMPLYLRANGDILALKKEELVSYDPNSREAKNVGIRIYKSRLTACNNYRESLLLLDKESGAVSKLTEKRCDKSKLAEKSNANVSKDEGRSIISDPDEIDSSKEEEKQTGRDADQ